MDRSSEVQFTLGTEASNASRLETASDWIYDLTKQAQTLTEGADQKDPEWLRQTPPRTLEDGTILILSFTQGRPDGDYASLLEIRSSSDGGKKMIERRWSNQVPADASLQEVVNSRIRPGGKRELDPEYPKRVGFKDEDFDRLTKMMGKFYTEGKGPIG